ncbi:MAG: TlpA disulfide reductase family protein [Acidobacteriota bacterium]
MKMFAWFFVAATLAGSVFAQGLTNRRAPSFSLPDSNFVQHDILDYRGKWLFLEFLMTTQQNCPSCKDITRRLDALATKYAGKLAALGIANTPPETQDTIKAFAAELKVKVPVVFDASMVAMAYFKATPQRPAIDPGHIFAINPDGMIVQDWTAAQVIGPNFDKEVDALLTGSGKATKSKAKK